VVIYFKSTWQSHDSSVELPPCDLYIASGLAGFRARREEDSLNPWTHEKMMPARQLIYLTLLLSLSGFCSSASTQPQYRQSSDGVSLTVDSLTVRILVCDERTFRVSVFPGEIPPSRPSLVVTRTWQPVRWTLQRLDSVLTLRTGRSSVTVDLSTGSICFFDKRGKLLTREEAMHPHEIVKAIVEGESTYHISQRFRLSAREGIYGLGQFEDGTMNYRNHRVTLIQNNRHVVVPFILSSRLYGIYWDNYSHTEFNDAPEGMTLWSEVADGIDYYLISGTTMDDVMAGYRGATGGVPMFPRWAFGYWQSKERYETQDQLMSVAGEYRRRGLPVDNLVLDWQYWGKLGWNAMAFDTASFPDPGGMIDSLHRLYNLNFMLSIWPQVDSATAVYRELKAGGYLYPTEIWNGGKTYDAYSPNARHIYWEHLNRGLYSLGVDAWWVDATEPDWKWCDSLLEEKKGIVMNGLTALGSASRYLNTYALMTTGGIYENQRKTNPSRRVVMLTRSAFAGQQRNSAAVWSGDIPSTWETFRHQIAGGINFSMAGIPYWNSDIGGFLPKEYGGDYPLGLRDPAYRELYVRWFQFGAFCPIFRAHGTDFPREIWQFGEPGSWSYEALVKFDRLRYRLLPYIYSVAARVTQDNYTMMRGLPMDFPEDSVVLSKGDAYMFGPAFLVTPVTREMYYPKHPGSVIPPSNLRTMDNGIGLTGKYYRGMMFDSLVQTRTDSSIDFRWTESGAPGVGKSNFTVRWEGKIRSDETGKYEFEIISDDGVNLWLDGRQLMDEMYPAGRQMNIGEAELKAGTWHDITLEYQQIDHGAEVALTWRTPSMLASYRPITTIQPMPVYLPGNSLWYDFWSGKTFPGGKNVETEVPLDIMPLNVRAGSIVPLGPLMTYSNERPADPIEIRVYGGASGRFNLYEDQNDGYGYEKGVFANIPFMWDDKKKILTIGARSGSFPGMLLNRTFEIVYVKENHGVGLGATARPDRVVRYSGKKVTIR